MIIAPYVFLPPWPELVGNTRRDRDDWLLEYWVRMQRANPALVIMSEHASDALVFTSQKAANDDTVRM